ncbi:AraC family transcriptional regulator [Paenibacillus sp. SYP-B4298]|uniref:AraC family transcriptional regulator n=1 Tax=Paenibacillus sp. SYP-B4298 TaxID=2996034 RepID=UPI0022DE3FA9|nr:AraC family transcriptional regulator [Paenibacillus sp. SYP-B4298]
MADFQYNPLAPHTAEPELHLLFWGKEACAPGHAVGPGVRDVYKVHLVHQGTGIVRVMDKEYALGAGEGFLIYPQVLTYYEADAVQPWVYSWLGFTGTRVPDLLKRTRLTPERPVFPMDMQVMPFLYERMTEALELGAASDLRLSILLHEYWAALIGEYPASRAARSAVGKQEGYVHQGLEYLHAHYSEQVTIGELAAYMGLDRKYLSVLFKEAVGMPPQQYLLHYRLEKASRLLRDTGYSVGEIAHSVGYRDALLFSRMFRRKYGMSPRQYRSQYTEQDIIP